MSSILGGGGGRDVTQHLSSIGGQGGGGGDFSKLLSQLGALGSSFGSDSEEDPVGDFISEILGETTNVAGDLPSHNLGSVSDRLLTPRAGAASSHLGPVEDRLISSLLGPSNPGGVQLPPIFSGLPGTGGPRFDSELGSNLGIPQFPNLQPLNIFQRQPL